jgi:hypothetical protein
MPSSQSRPSLCCEACAPPWRQSLLSLSSLILPAPSTCASSHPLLHGRRSERGGWAELRQRRLTLRRSQMTTPAANLWKGWARSQEPCELQAQLAVGAQPTFPSFPWLASLPPTRCPARRTPPGLGLGSSRYHQGGPATLPLRWSAAPLRDPEESACSGPTDLLVISLFFRDLCFKGSNSCPL